MRRKVKSALVSWPTYSSARCKAGSLVEEYGETMKEFKDKVAVITGAASGIGRAIAKRGAQEGMKLVLADIEEEALTQTEAEIQTLGATVRAVLTDVSRRSDVEALAQAALSVFGSVDLLCNNAGVGAGTSIWESTMNDWKWVLGVNLWGVIHGIRVFVPIMLGQDSESQIVNTASMAGLTAYPGAGIYKVTKHAIVSLSETLYLELGQRETRLKVSVLCPGFVNTRLPDSRRNRPAELDNEPAKKEPSPEEKERLEAARKVFEEGMSPGQVADCLFKGLREDKFYIFTHPERKPMVKLRMEDILYERNPSNSRALMRL
jgi:NADP-dependent 3-hydroxy acid dehydrogenase YdfG